MLSDQILDDYDEPGIFHLSCGPYSYHRHVPVADILELSHIPRIAGYQTCTKDKSTPFVHYIARFPDEFNLDLFSLKKISFITQNRYTLSAFNARSIVKKNKASIIARALAYFKCDIALQGFIESVTLAGISMDRTLNYVLEVVDIIKQFSPCIHDILHDDSAICQSWIRGFLLRYDFSFHSDTRYYQMCLSLLRDLIDEPCKEDQEVIWHYFVDTFYAILLKHEFFWYWKKWSFLTSWGFDIIDLQRNPIAFMVKHDRENYNNTNHCAPYAIVKTTGGCCKIWRRESLLWESLDAFDAMSIFSDVELVKKYAFDQNVYDNKEFCSAFFSALHCPEE